MLLLLACTAVTGEPNKGKCSREVTSPSLLDFRLHVTRLKMSLLQFRFSCQSGPDPLPKKKVKPNEERKEEQNKKKEKKSECCTTKSKSQSSHSQGNFQNAWLSQFGWLMFDRESQICGVTVCVCVVLQKIGFQNLYPLEYFKEVENTL